MKKLLTLVLAITTLTANAKTITTQEYSKLFERYNACFILYSVNEHKIENIK